MIPKLPKDNHMFVLELEARLKLGPTLRPLKEKENRREISQILQEVMNSQAQGS